MSQRVHEKDVHKFDNKNKALPTWSKNGILHYNVQKNYKSYILQKISNSKGYLY
jgi:hypothetical protein